MAGMLQPSINKNCMACMDDVIVLLKKESEHFAILYKCFKPLQNAVLKLKCLIC